jgi:hypothetical protein
LFVLLLCAWDCNSAWSNSSRARPRTVLDKLGDRAQAIAQAKAALKIYEQIESPYADQVRKQLAEWQNV